jgi:hypothetical protein
MMAASTLSKKNAKHQEEGTHDSNDRDKPQPNQ